MDIFLKRVYPENFINNCFKRFLDKKQNSRKHGNFNQEIFK